MDMKEEERKTEWNKLIEKERKNKQEGIKNFKKEINSKLLELWYI